MFNLFEIKHQAVISASITHFCENKKQSWLGRPHFTGWKIPLVVDSPEGIPALPPVWRVHRHP